ncbi:RING finger protein 11a isoform X2 [Mustelus asterias]
MIFNKKNMGNCFKSQTGDDISLLNDSGAAGGGAPDSEAGPGLVLALPPPHSALHQEQVQIPVYHPTPSQTRLATQLTEEEQIRIAQRLGLIQHLPKGSFDLGKDSQNKKIKEWIFPLLLHRGSREVPVASCCDLGSNGSCLVPRGVQVWDWKWSG